MSKLERQIYDRFIDNRRIALGQYITALNKGIRQERKIQEEKIKQLEENHNKELQEKDSMLQELANMLLEQGFTKEQIFAKTGVKL